mgnify:CR=1 FL=1
MSVAFWAMMGVGIVFSLFWFVLVFTDRIKITFATSIPLALGVLLIGASIIRNVEVGATGVKFDLTNAGLSDLTQRVARLETALNSFGEATTSTISALETADVSSGTDAAPEFETARESAASLESLFAGRKDANIYYRTARADDAASIRRALNEAGFNVVPIATDLSELPGPPVGANVIQYDPEMTGALELVETTVTSALGRNATVETREMSRSTAGSIQILLY